MLLSKLIVFGLAYAMTARSQGPSGPPSTATESKPCGCEEDGVTFCNFDYGTWGFCEKCDRHNSEQSCHKAGLPLDGALDCVKRCINIGGYRTLPDTLCSDPSWDRRLGHGYYKNGVEKCNSLSDCNGFYQDTTKLDSRGQNHYILFSGAFNPSKCSYQKGIITWVREGPVAKDDATIAAENAAKRAQEAKSEAETVMHSAFDSLDNFMHEYDEFKHDVEDDRKRANDALDLAKAEAANTYADNAARTSYDAEKAAYESMIKAQELAKNAVSMAHHWAALTDKAFSIAHQAAHVAQDAVSIDEARPAATDLLETASKAKDQAATAGADAAVAESEFRTAVEEWKSSRVNAEKAALAAEEAAENPKARCTSSEMTCPIPKYWRDRKVIYTLPTQFLYDISGKDPVRTAKKNPECLPSSKGFKFTKEQCGSTQTFNGEDGRQVDYVKLVPFGRTDVKDGNVKPGDIGAGNYIGKNIKWVLEGKGNCTAGDCGDLNKNALSCHEICTVQEGLEGCDQKSIDDLNDVEKIHNAFRKAGYKCDTSKNDMGCMWRYYDKKENQDQGHWKNHCEHWGSPYLYNRENFLLEGRCFFGNGLSARHATCSERHVDSNHRRLCPCIAAEPPKCVEITLKGQTCCEEDVIVSHSDCIPNHDPTDSICANDHTPDESYCHYKHSQGLNRGNPICARCAPPRRQLINNQNFQFTNDTSRKIITPPDINCFCEQAWAVTSKGYDFYGNIMAFPAKAKDEEGDIEGSVSISVNGKEQTLVFKLKNVEADCKNCPIRIYSGRCEEAPVPPSKDGAVYNSNADREATGEVTVNSEGGPQVVVVYNRARQVIGCAKLRENSDMVKVEEEAPNMIKDQDIKLKGKSSLSARLNIYHDADFLELYENTYEQSFDRADVSTDEYIPDTTDPKVTKRLYLQVSSTWHENHVTIRNCWAAPTKDSLDKEDGDSVRFYSKYCSANLFEAKPEENKDLHHLSRLSVRKFKFDGTEQLWMKCEIVACKKAPCGTCGDGPRYPHLEDDRVMRSMMVTFGDMNRRTLKSGENSLVKMFENKKRSLQSQISAGSNKSNIFAVKVPRHASRQEYLVLPRSIQHSASNPISSLLTTMFGPTELEKGIKIEKLLDRKTQIAFHHGRVEGSLVLGAPADKWATDINARKSLENTLEAILNLSAKERVHVLSVGRVTVNDRRSLMRFKRILSTGSAGVSQVDYAIELAADSDTALVSGAVMSLSLGESDTTQFITRLNQELLSSGSTPVPPKAMLGFGMPLTYKEASNVGATGHDPSGADGHTTVVYTFSSGTRPAYDKYGVSIAERDEADTNSSTAQAGFDSSALMYMLYGFGGIVGLCALAHGGKHLYKKYTAHSKRNTVQKFGSVLPEQQINNWTPPGSDIITVPNTELAMARKLEMNYPMTVIPGEKPDVALELASKVSTASPKSGDIGDGQSSHGSQDLKALTPLN